MKRRIRLSRLRRHETDVRIARAMRNFYSGVGNRRYRREWRRIARGYYSLSKRSRK